MRETLPICANLEEDRIRHPPTEMNCDSKGIGHHNEIREYATAAKQHVPVTGDELDGSEGPGERLERRIQCHE
jgi:hypothetical protein